MYLVAILLIVVLNLRLGLVRTFCFSLPTISFGLLGASALLLKKNTANHH